MREETMAQRRDVRPVRAGRRIVVKRKTGIEWLPIVIVLLLLIIGGLVAWYLLSDNNENVPAAEGAVALVRLVRVLI
jgi:flagellar basal body-associated protein FliL